MRARVIPAGGEERLFGKRPARVRAVSVGETEQLPRQARAGTGRVVVRQIELKEKALPARVLQHVADSPRRVAAIRQHQLVRVERLRQQRLGVAADVGVGQRFRAGKIRRLRVEQQRLFAVGRD